MAQAAAILLILLIVCEAFVETFALPVPGAAIGLLLLSLAFAIQGAPDPHFEELFDFAAPYFPLFFVPAAVGVIASMDMLALAWPLILLAIVGGTAITLVITGWVFQALIHRLESAPNND